MAWAVLGFFICTMLALPLALLTHHHLTRKETK
jgi:ABC-type phosphate/phosphonate transport system permease subunit